MTHEHLEDVFRICICMVSTSRYGRWGEVTTPPEDDVSGRKAIEMVERKGYACSYILVPDDRDRIRDTVEQFMEKE